MTNARRRSGRFIRSVFSARVNNVVVVLKSWRRTTSRSIVRWVGVKPVRVSGHSRERTSVHSSRIRHVPCHKERSRRGRIRPRRHSFSGCWQQWRKSVTSRWMYRFLSWIRPSNARCYSGREPCGFRWTVWDWGLGMRHEKSRSRFPQRPVRRSVVRVPLCCVFNIRASIPPSNRRRASLTNIA